MKLFENIPFISFVAMRRWAYVFSAIFLFLAIAAMVWQGGLRYGVDFSGGVAVQIQFNQPVPDEAVKQSLDSLGYPGLSVQRYGEDGRDYLIRFTAEENTADETSETIAGDQLRLSLNATLSKAFPDNDVQILRTEVVGPKVGSDLRNSALEAVYYVVLLITVYISGRFEQRWTMAGLMAAGLAGGMYLLSLAGAGLAIRVAAVLTLTLALCWKFKLNFALGAVVGLMHDVLITVGLLTVMGKEFDLNIVAAVLTLIGYSLNDTIIIYDRIRENLRAEETDSGTWLGTIIDNSLNQTLSRTIMTSLTTMVAVLSLFFLGGGVIHDFALTMMIGMVVGTFSSMFVSSPILLALGTTEQYAALVHVEEYERPAQHGIV